MYEYTITVILKAVYRAPERRLPIFRVVAKDMEDARRQARAIIGLELYGCDDDVTEADDHVEIIVDDFPLGG